MSLFTKITNTFLRTRSYCSVAPLEQYKPPSDRLYTKNYLTDKIRIYVKGGSGGQGAPSAGGIGGNGGNVYIKCKDGETLNQFMFRRNRRIIAGHGSHFIKGRLKVSKGTDAYIAVPPGTEVRSAENALLLDMNKPNHVLKIANGGVGGSHKTKDFNGKKGESKNIVLELKTIADASLTGFPNAGKSMLLRALSRATPKIGNYPFTTIKPIVGTIDYSDMRSVKVADLPGLIEEAHLNRGMGHKFLRHIERTKIVVLVIDVNGFQLKEKYAHRSPIDMIVLLLKELVLYQELLLSRPFLLVLNKMDTENSCEKCEQLLEGLSTIDVNHPLLEGVEFAEAIVEQIRCFTDDNFANVFRVSALECTGIDELKLGLHHHIHGQKKNDEE